MTPKKAEGQNQGRRKSPSKLLKKKIFYLDIKSRAASSVRTLIDDIQALGGTIEEFFSKDITTVVTDAPVVKLKAVLGTCNEQNRVEGSATAATANASAAGGAIFSPSPHITWSPASVEETAKPKNKTRAETILERAKQQNQQQNNKPFDLLETATKWGLEVWSLSKLLKWFDIQKQKHCFHKTITATRKSTGSSAVQPGLEVTPDVTKKRSRSLGDAVQSVGDGVRKLTSPYIKFESTDCRYRPVYQEFGRFPKLCFYGNAGLSPFYNTPAPQEQQPKPARVAVVNNPIKNKLRRIQEPPEVPRVREEPKSKRKEEVESESEKEKREGYCELCEQHYNKLMVHLEDEKHRSRVQNAELWWQLDECIDMANKVYNGCDEALECSV